MDKNEILKEALKTRSKKESMTILCINMLESLYDKINIKDLESIRSYLARYHRKYYTLKSLKKEKE